MQLGSITTWTQAFFLLLLPVQTMDSRILILLLILTSPGPNRLRIFPFRGTTGLHLELS